MNFFLCKKFCIGCGPFYPLNSWSFWPVIDSFFFIFYTLLIFKVMLRNSNLTMLDMLTLSNSNMTAPTLKTNEHLKKTNKTCFFLHFANSNLKVIISHFIFNIKKIISYLESTQNLCVQEHIHTVMTVKKVAKNPIFLKKITFL